MHHWSHPSRSPSVKLRIVRFVPSFLTAQACTRSTQACCCGRTQRMSAAMLPTRCAARGAVRVLPRMSICLAQARALSTSVPFGAEAVSPSTSKKRKPLTQEQREFLASALRVNQAGELAATLIYTAQTPLLVRQHPHLRPLMKHMYDQEAGHFDTFNELIRRHRVRPTALYPLWSVLATGLGWSTAVMGREAAMACTEAVETEIGGHYNNQIRVLLEVISGWEAEGYEVGGEIRELVSTLRRIRDEELEHLDHAVEHDAKKAEPHWLLTGVIRAGCRGAIWVSERV
ncbi:ubiquinone biosynthesis monooxygenase Coq7 [Purpureocillium takamizusanense]|uniref:5-demethoxyubiquinone hydroxylase, mitochondrial n=1 Tax=Purpureocillium takamizusanense TaxID=2060973 RepID=A0A9Q8QA17_9HYPO|nr:ubiquinone biosynthesis monooxygenase Coq7 [Purpureocillium takamizusanense]UNI15825.1 ubiquinone biosynthesis monooxygenase Coq7 [Purpureocillium takamizusanense]